MQKKKISLKPKEEITQKTELSPFQTPKLMHMNQVRELIDYLYSTKKGQGKDNQPDKISLSARTPLKTMEEHVVSVLQKRYGLKSIVEENIKNFYKSIAFYEKENVHIYVFDKILKFNVEEEFVKVLDAVTQSIQLILLYLLRSQNSNMTEQNLQSIYKNCLMSDIPLETAFKIVRLLYSAKDCETLKESFISFSFNKE